MAGRNELLKNRLAMKNNPLNSSISTIKGVGPKRAELLAKKGINSILDLFYFIPKSYEDRTSVLSISEIKADRPAFVKGKVLWAGEEKLFRQRKKLYKIIIGDGHQNLELVWFNLKKNFLAAFTAPGLEITAYGIVRQSGNKCQIYHPDVSVHDKNMGAPGFLPLYPSIEGVSNKILRAIVQTALDQHLEKLVDPLPADLLDKSGLPGLKDSIGSLHFPDIKTDYNFLNNADTEYHKRLLFDRFFRLMLKIFYGKQLKKDAAVIPYRIDKELFQCIDKFFPFNLTDDQITCIKEIKNDLTSGRIMNRLIMGDVGTGKTIIAVAAAYMVINNNHQVSIMAPTQLLAEQHMSYFQSLPSEMGFKPVLVTGGMKRSVRERINNSVEKGRYNIIIGTHSLIQDRLNFHNLGLAIIDEQHRFGVDQRSRMIAKSKNTHALTMSATPIPRTIAVILYGDMDISVIKEYPHSHIPVDTIIVNKSKKRWIFDKLRQKLSDGHQAYIICPIIEDSDNSEMISVSEMAKSLRKILSPPFRIDYIHGQMESEKKERIISEFRKGEINVLVGTTVIEVGIHVPNASLMIIEHPERLGLSQLHQLRGRIGRDGKGGTCLLIASENASSRTMERLNIMSKCHDGFEISRKDMENRGHGEIAGTRQSGFRELGISEVVNHYDLLKTARDFAGEIIDSDPGLLLPENRNLKTLVDDVTEITI